MFCPTPVAVRTSVTVLPTRCRTAELLLLVRSRRQSHRHNDAETPRLYNFAAIPSRTTSLTHSAGTRWPTPRDDATLWRTTFQPQHLPIRVQHSGFQPLLYQPQKRYGLTHLLDDCNTRYEWLVDLNQLGLAPNQKHQAFLGAPKIVHCGEKIERSALITGSDCLDSAFREPVNFLF